MRELVLSAFLYQFQPLSQLEIVAETHQEETEAAVWHRCRRGGACLQSRLSKVKVGDQKSKASPGYRSNLGPAWAVQYPCPISSPCKVKTAKRKREQEYEAV